MKDRIITPLKKGQAVIFRSTEKHRATSPTEGERISFTIWAMTLNKSKQSIPNTKR
jgi:predicted 2-oxoglutarate/Fe(II)-dependent dioxygenase YbiX